MHLFQILKQFNLLKINMPKKFWCSIGQGCEKMPFSALFSALLHGLFHLPFTFVFSLSKRDTIGTITKRLFCTCRYGCTHSQIYALSLKIRRGFNVFQNNLFLTIIELVLAEDLPRSLSLSLFYSLSLHFAFKPLHTTYPPFK